MKKGEFGVAGCLGRRWMTVPVLCGLLAAAAFAAEPTVIPLWPGTAPGSEGADYPETEIIQGVKQIHNVTKPTLLAFLPEAAKATGSAWVICPGGGFQWLAIEYEGTDLARWLNANGVAAFVLKYRLMRTGDGAPQDRAQMRELRATAIAQAVADGQQAVKLVRAHAAEWRISQDRIGIIGFSAGGYVAAAVALQHDDQSRPDFAAPIYGLMPLEIRVPADAPPIFLAQADDDRTVPTVENTVRLYTAWKKAGVPAEMHIYLRGGHGFGMLKKGLPTDSWIDRFHDWLELQGLLKPVR
jgi:acetyl esterase/lipase